VLHEALLEAARESIINMKPQNPTVPLVLSLVACFLFGISIIVAGYFKGNMHIETVWYNLHNFH
tara:strand:+ start:254 stop:445 length:192 start_codon:yes stop_codon:yes gene_type:complete